MYNKKLLIPAFAIMVVLQWYFPVQMIRSNEQVLEIGKEYKFRVTQVDPNDPFRGKFIMLQFSETIAVVDEQTNWLGNEDIYLTFREDPNGFAVISGVTKTIPANTENYLKANVEYESRSNMIGIRYPFDRFYMDEFKAPLAEEVYLQATIDTHQVAYAVINVLNGHGVIKDVMIDGISVRELADQSAQE
jgi:uncharacterized membrane-anchored protein